MTPPEPIEVSNVESNKISKNKIAAAKNSLTPNTQRDTPPIAPRTSSNGALMSLESLKPPPPPPKIPVRVKGSSVSARTEIISELKDMFVKRGLVTRWSYYILLNILKIKFYFQTTHLFNILDKYTLGIVKKYAKKNIFTL